MDGRPGASMKPADFGKLTKDLVAKYGPLRDVDVMSYVQYPKVRAVCVCVCVSH